MRVNRLFRKFLLLALPSYQHRIFQRKKKFGSVTGQFSTVGRRHIELEVEVDLLTSFIYSIFLLM